MSSIATWTFLFTDIEGSSRMWEEEPDAMRDALAKHDAIMRTELATGHVFKTVGDAFYAAFPSPTEAIQAALRIQKSLMSESWGVFGKVLVRVALHTGEAETRDNDYFGPALNRLSRLISTGYGGQVLLSQSTYELIRDSLPKGTEARPLGEHRLRDLERPENIYQLVVEGIPCEFPALKSLSELPNNLPLQVNTFIGREKELAEVEALVRKHRLITLTGAGGTGKTRLGLQVAADVLPEFEDGVWLVELAPLTEAHLVPQAIAEAIRVREEPGRPLQDTLLAFLKDKQTLIVLDNCEHLLDATARLAHSIGRQCPRVQLLATSREPLGISGEQVYRVPSLSTPDPRKRESVEALSQYEAVRLFIDRALLGQPSFAVTNANAPSVAQICHRLDGIPLALELAAARARTMPAETIAARLDDRFRLLTGGSRTALPRQQTLRATIDWSYGLLDEKEKSLLRRLSVFAGGWTLEAAEKICADDGDLLDTLNRLVDQSMATFDDATGRYALLESVRGYALEQLQESGYASQLASRHLEYFADSAARLSTSDSMGERLRPDLGNIRQALDYPSASAQAISRLVANLGPFWHQTGLWAEGLARTRRSLESASPDWPEYIELLHQAGRLAFDCCDYDLARQYAERTAPLYEKAGPIKKYLEVRNLLAVIVLEQQGPEAALPYFERNLEDATRAGDEQAQGIAMGNLGGCLSKSNPQRALELYHAALNRSQPGSIFRFLVLTNICSLQGMLGNLRESLQSADQALGIAKRLENDACRIDALNRRSEAQTRCQEIHGAALDLKSSLEAMTPETSARYLAGALQAARQLASAVRDHEATILLDEATAGIFKGLRFRPGYLSDPERVAAVTAAEQGVGSARVAELRALEPNATEGVRVSLELIDRTVAQISGDRR